MANVVDDVQFLLHVVQTSIGRVVVAVAAGNGQVLRVIDHSSKSTIITSDHNGHSDEDSQHHDRLHSVRVRHRSHSTQSLKHENHDGADGHEGIKVELST